MLNDFDELRQVYTVKDFFQTAAFCWIQFDAHFITLNWI